MTAPALQPQECPRVVAPYIDGSRRFVTCGHTLPCPYHGAPLFVVCDPVTPDSTGGEGSE